MAAKPGPLLAIAAAGALIFMSKKKKDDEPVKIDPKPGTNGQNGGSSQGEDPQSTPEPEEHDHSSYGDGTADIVAERAFADLDNANPIEFKPNKQGEAVLITDIDSSWDYEARFPAAAAGSETDFAEIVYDNGNLLWISTAGARPLDELKLEGIPDPTNPSHRVLIAWM